MGKKISTTHETVVSTLSSFHTRSFMQASSAISFRLPPASISAAASFRLTVFRLSASLSRLDLPQPCADSDQLSDPRCFRFLSSASVLGSDYSASVSSVPSSSRFCLTMLSPVLGSPLGFPSFPFLRSGFPCRFPVIGTWLSVCFLSPFPASLPQPLVRCSFRFSASRFSGPIRILASASVSFPVTQPSASSVPFSSDPRLTAAWTLLSSPLGSLSSPSASILSYWVSGYRYLAF